MTPRVSSKGAGADRGACLIAVTAVCYQPGLRMGFYLDDYNYLERAGETDWSTALEQIFDPRAQTMWYRPLQGPAVLYRIPALGGNANGYHLVNIAFHSLNVLLLLTLVARLSKQWRYGFLAGFSLPPFRSMRRA